MALRTLPRGQIRSVRSALAVRSRLCSVATLHQLSGIPPQATHPLMILLLFLLSGGEDSLMGALGRSGRHEVPVTNLGGSTDIAGQKPTLTTRSRPTC
jgi:hypothetical protein